MDDRNSQRLLVVLVMDLLAILLSPRVSLRATAGGVTLLNCSNNMPILWVCRSLVAGARPSAELCNKLKHCAMEAMDPATQREPEGAS